MKKLITNLSVIPSISNPIPLLYDKNGAIAQTKEPRSHQKLKHILRHFHLIWEIIARGDVVMERVTDLLTKPLAQEVFERHFKCTGLVHKGD